jgi:hypothetical protein
MVNGVVEDAGLPLQYADTRLRFKVERRMVAEVLRQA